MNYLYTILTSIIALTIGHDVHHWRNEKLQYPTIMQQRAEAVIQNPALLKFTSLNKEVSLPSLNIQGTIPSWLNGTFIQNSAAKFETSQEIINHAFDGFAMLHAFSFKQGNVAYTNQFIKSNYYTQAMATGTIEKGFSGSQSPLLYKKILSYFSSKLKNTKYDNTNVSVSKISQEFVALTETPDPIIFNDQTLETKGYLIFEDNLKGQVSTAHPLTDFETEETFNYLTEFGKDSYYHVYSIPFNNKTRKLIASIPVENPSYMHSFSITKNYIILTEIPFTVNPLSLLFSNKPFIKNFQWKPENGTIFTIINRHNGDFKRLQGEPFFTFHHVDAFEQNNSVVVDLIAYEKPHIESLSLEQLFNQIHTTKDNNQLKRFFINLQTMSVTSKTLVTDCSIEMPSINNRYSMKPYQYVYTIKTDNDKNHQSSLIKIDVHNNTITEWKANNCFVSEPTFVAHPNAQHEDDGVILSIVLDATMKHSFLLILDAKTLKEIARAFVPHHIPFSLHGAFFKN